MKQSGRDVYDELESRIRQVASERRVASDKVHSSERVISRLENQKNQRYIELAHIYLPDLDASSIEETVSSYQKEVQRIYNQKQDRILIVEKGIENTEKLIDKRKEKIKNQDTLLDDLNEQREAIETKIADELEQGEAYVTLLNEADQAKKSLEVNIQRYESFKEDAKSKLTAYKQDNLFMYLARRGYGSSQYKKGTSSIIKNLDALVARKVNFTDQVQEYNYLLDMPGKLKEEIERRDSLLNEKVSELRKKEKEVEDKYGLSEIQSNAQEAYEERQTDLAGLTRLEGELQSYLGERNRLNSTTGAYHSTAIEKLTNYLKGETIQDLERRAKETPDPKDDHLVERINKYSTQIEQEKELLEELKDELRKYDSIEQKLRSVNREFTSNDYEAKRSQFDSSFNMDSLLDDLIEGSISTITFNSRVDRAQSWKPKPKRRTSRSYGNDDDFFGGGGFGSGGGYSGGGFSSGGFGGGGFTSGGFGGGGSTTGGF